MVRPARGDGFAFIPRSVVLQPAAFGLAHGLLVPAAGYSRESERYRAAMIQHVMCVTARAEIVKATGKSPALYVEGSTQYGLGQDRVRRIFRGATMAQLTDLAFWAGRFPEVDKAVAAYTATWSEEKPPTEQADEPVELTPRELRELQDQVAPKRVHRSPQHGFG